MTRHALVACGLFAAMITTGAHAAQIAWTFTGTVAERFDAVADDPIADLLGVPRASVNDVDFSLRIVIDTEAARDLIANTAAVQQVIYEDAIVSAALSLNGVEFATLRRPDTFLGGAIDESDIRITNGTAPAATDNLTLTLGGLIFTPVIPPLFESYSVPFNQTIGGTPVANAEVLAPFMSINISGPGMFGGVDLPAANGAFAGANFVAIGMTVMSDFGLGFGNGGIVLEAHETDFTASPVPLPGGAALLAPALAVLIRRRRRVPG
ncbi:MAG: hypothetical protein AB7I32_18610 [Gammaproteobacteria bacterium]